MKKIQNKIDEQCIGCPYLLGTKTEQEDTRHCTFPLQCDDETVSEFYTIEETHKILNNLINK